MTREFWLLALLFGLTACQQSKRAAPVFHAEGRPELLSQWNLFSVGGGALTLNDRVTAYDLATPLFTDYAHKLRTIWLPEGRSAVYDADESFDFPVGTVISKTFYYPLGEEGGVLRSEDQTPARLSAGFDLKEVRLIETRILVRREAGWAALPYIWNAEQSDAQLKRTGDIKRLSMIFPDSERKDFAYIAPDENQCAGCHATNATTREILPIGPKARHLNKLYDYRGGAKNQLTAWSELGVLTGLPESVSGNPDIPKSALWDDDSQPLDFRARTYLDINCAHCHNSRGPADTSGLLLESSDPAGPSLGICKLPIAAGAGTGGRDFDIVPGQPDHSIFPFRITSTDPAIMMPEVGRSLVHTEGAELIAQWIEQMQGGCD